MVDLVLDQFQGVTATITLGQPLTMVSGPNGAGKTRIARALAAVLSETALPMTGKRGDLRECLTDGEGRASVVLRNGESVRAVMWDDGKGDYSLRGPQDMLPRASKYAAGLVSPLSLAGKERAAAFAEIFKTEPTQKNLEDALEKRGLSGHLDALWRAIDISGWDAAASEAADTARQLKGAWSEATGGAIWGSRIGETWEPDDKRSPDASGLEQEIKVAEQALDVAKGELEKAKAERAKLPQNAVDNAHECPHCGGSVAFRQGKIIKAEPVDAAKIREIRMAIAGADGDVRHAEDRVHEAERAIGAAQARLQDASQAREKAKARAAELHLQIVEHVEIATVCGPKGLRQAKLEHVLGKVNESLTALAREAGLPILKIDAELEATLSGTPYHRLSEGQSWIARAIMQIEVARRDNSTIVVLDHFERVADPKVRESVLYAISSTGLQAVVAQAAWTPSDEEVFDLAAAGYGVTYWIDPAKGLRPISEARQVPRREAA